VTKVLIVALITAAIWWYIRKPLAAKKRPRPTQPPAQPDAAEARAILGIGADAGAEDIRAAHRRLVTALHPDKGGSTELTRRINAARDLLLRQLD
jgi:CysZ protein